MCWHNGEASIIEVRALDLFADGEGIPFTLNSQTATTYLSLKYPVWASEATATIGVSPLSPKEFLQDLSLAVTQDPTTFRARSAIWHSHLAETLAKLGSDLELLSMIKDICLIPLQDGTWTSARGHVIFFSKGESSLKIPSGIEVFSIDSTAECDPNRCKLFNALGVKRWEAQEICRLVLKIHASSDFKPKSLTRDELVSHAMFLYTAKWQPPKTADLWFATIQDERCQGRKLYIPGSIKGNSPEGRIFSQLKEKFAVIHNEYLEMLPLDPDWTPWLVDNLGLSMVPRLITPHIDPEPQPVKTSEAPEMEHTDVLASGNLTIQDYHTQSPLLDDQKKTRLHVVQPPQNIFALSEEFIFMFRKCNTSDVLQLIRDNWHHYSKWIDGAHMKWQNAGFLESSAHLKNTLSNFPVQSAKGPMPLRETVLPMIDPELDEGRDSPALDIKDPHHPEWTLLSYFGVIMKGDIEYYLRCLIAVSETPFPEIDKVAYIYEQIQIGYKGNEDLIRAAFYERDILFVHLKSQSTTEQVGWMNMNECISRNIPIEFNYPSSSYLFRCLLSLQAIL